MISSLFRFVLSFHKFDFAEEEKFYCFFLFFHLTRNHFFTPGELVS